MGYARTSLRREKRDLPDDLGVYRARQAQALAGVGKPEQAVAVAGEIVPLVPQTSSSRMRAEQEGVRRSMRPWKSQPLGKALEEVLVGIRTA